MESSLIASLENTEAKWLQVLYSKCMELFGTVFLPSHDHKHHARVWQNARTILEYIDSRGICIPRSLPEELIIAVFFHDTGLAKTKGEKHGEESRNFCERFFRENIPGVRKPENESFERILFAIEHHDDKSLRKGSSDGGLSTDLLGLLSASDDVDAFGRMGIYRYAEIYMLRGVKPEELPARVTANVQNRFNNLTISLAELTEFINIQESRFRVVFDFYLNLAQAFASRIERPTWEPVLIEVIYDSLLRKENILSPERILPDTEFNRELGDWFRALDNENQPAF